MQAEAKRQPRVTGAECGYCTYVIASSRANCGGATNLAEEFLLTMRPGTAKATLFAIDSATYERIKFHCTDMSRFGPYRCSDAKGAAVYLLAYRAPRAPHVKPAHVSTFTINP